MTAQRIRSVFGVICLLLPLRSECAEPEERTFASSVLTTVREHCQRAPIGGSTSLVTAIAEETGLSETDARQELLALLDTLDAARTGKTDLWRGITESGQPQMEPKTAARFLKYVLSESRKILNKEGADYSLDHKLNEASRKAKLTSDEGREFLVRLLGSSSEADSWILPAKFGLLVKVKFPQFSWYIARGSTNTEKRKELVESISLKLPNQDNTFVPFFQSNDPDEIGDRLITIRSRISHALVLDLPGSTRIKWAINLPSPSLQPEYELAITQILGIFRVSPGGEEGQAGYWLLELHGTVELVHIETGRHLFRDSVFVPQYHEIGIGNYEEIFDQISVAFAEAVRVQLDDHFAGNR